MDEQRFDRWTRFFGRAVNRRRGLTGVVATIAATTTGWLASPGVNAAPKAERCVANGDRCGKTSKNNNNKGPCKKCCSRYFTATPNGKRRCSCKPNGLACGNSSQCCNGQCTDGVCFGLLPVCIPEGENCPDGGRDCCDLLVCVTGACQVDCAATLTAAGCIQDRGTWDCRSTGGRTVNLAGANLSGCDLGDSSFVQTDLSNAIVTGTDFEEASFTGANVTGVKWNNTNCPTSVNSDNNGGTCCGQLDSTPAAGCAN